MSSIPISKLSIGEAFTAIALTMIKADKKLVDIEQKKLLLHMQAMNTFEAYTPEQLHETFEKMFDLYQEIGSDALIQLARQSLSLKLSEAAFFLATDLSIADSILADEEKEMLTRLQNDLRISDDVAIQVIEVVLIKNRM
ncbi:MAG: tellurite resistance TerB family protein [Psychromonas sp.]|nr:tellurite resistance TerB family protein [Psychromonas sp.]